MSALPWFRLYHRMVDDEKLRLLAFEDRWHFVALCCMKASGLLDEQDSALRNRKLAVKLGIQVRELEEVARRLQEVNLIDGNLNPLAWDELQYRSDNSTDRVKKFRQKQAVVKVKRKRNVSVTVQDTDTDTDTEKKEEKVVFVFPDCIPKKQWDDFKAHRGKKFTKKAQELALKKLEGWHNEGYDIKQILENSVMNGWSGLFLPKDSKNQKANVKSDVQNQMEDILKNGW